MTVDKVRQLFKLNKERKETRKMQENRLDMINRLNTLLEVMNVILEDLTKTIDKLNEMQDEDKKGDK